MSTLKPITCPSCGAGSFEHDDEGNLICSHCGVKFASPREQIVCPACHTRNDPDARVCMNCGLTLGKICPVCNHVNPPGSENCLQCGTPLDAISSLTTRFGEGKRRSDALREQVLIAQKGDDMLFMQHERERINAEERARQMELARQQGESRRQQSTIMIVGIAVLVLIVASAVVLSLLLSAPK